MALVAKELGLGYNDLMDMFPRLESEVQGLVARVHELEARLAQVGEQCAALQEENRTLRLSLSAEKAVREEALAKINTLTSKIEAHLGAEKVS